MKLKKAPTHKVKKKTKPFGYQGIGIFRMTHRFNGRSLLADDVGLGKSIQALYASIPYRRKLPILAIVPSPVKLGWEQQVREHTNLTCQLLRTRSPPPSGIEKPADVIVINWEILHFWEKAIKKLKFGVVIVDEVHFAKSPGAARTKALRRICKDVPHIFCLSGTPIENSPYEFFVPLNILRPDVFTDYRAFAFKYSIPRYTHWGVKYSGARNQRELSRLLKTTCMVRRTKKQVLKDLPPLVRDVVPLEIDMRRYITAEKNIAAYLRKHKPDKPFKKRLLEQTKLNHLLQIVCDLKFDSVVKWIENFLVTTDKKLCVFAHHRAFLERMHDRFKNNSVLVYGGLGDAKRRKAIQRFVKDPGTRVFFGGILAVGTGINDLQHVCSDMAIAELIWVGIKLLQVEGRLHRVGQRKQVNVRYLIAPHTVEELLCKSVLRKQKDINAVVDSKYNKSEFDIFQTVLKKMMKGARR